MHRLSQQYVKNHFATVKKSSGFDTRIKLGSKKKIHSTSSQVPSNAYKNIHL